MLVIFHTWTCFAMPVLSPGVSSRGPRWASSRTQHRHCCCPERSCCTQPSSSEEKAAEGWHTCAAKRAQRHSCAVQPSPELSSGAEILLPVCPSTTPAFILFLLQPGGIFPMSSYACPSTLHLSQGHLHDTEHRRFPSPPAPSSHSFSLLFLLTNSCQKPLPPAFRV